VGYTLKSSVHCSGVGVHSGQPLTLRLCPALKGTGYVFERVDLEESKRFIPATFQNITNSKFNTQIGFKDVVISTVEHVLAALTACHITDMIIQIDGPEMPVMDGSSGSFVKIIQEGGLAQVSDTRSFLVLDKELFVETSYGSSIQLMPASYFSIQVVQDFKGREGVQNQFFKIEDVYCSFAEQIARARTFGFYQDAEKMWAAGLSKGASLENTVVVKEGVVMNEKGLRFDNECARHKALDIIGDFALLGYGLQLACHAQNPGHELNAMVMKALLENPGHWHIEEKLVKPSFEI
tara:strand:- start:9189 stop:10070 length:882 start_codon:yes stop_codon:yes gene_type:complete